MYRLRLLNVMEDMQYLYMVFEYREGTSLYKWVVRNNDVTEEQIKILFKDLCLQLRSIHRLGICHRDIKLDNILVLKNQET